MSCSLRLVSRFVIFEKDSILMGNPGTSKSIFQWSMLHCLIKNVGLGKYTRPDVIIRQVGGGTLFFIFPEHGKVYIIHTVHDDILNFFDPKKVCTWLNRLAPWLNPSSVLYKLL